MHSKTTHIKNTVLNTRTITFATIMLLFFSLMFAIEFLNGRFELNDFRVIYDASSALFSGEQVYGVNFGLATGFYKYSPFTAILFGGFTIFSFKTASIIYYWIIALLSIITFVKIENFLQKHFFNSTSSKWWIPYIIVLFVLLHFIRELHLGNTNLLLLLLTLFGLEVFLKNKYYTSGIFLAIVILTKPYLIVLMLPFLFQKKWKVIFYTVFAGVIFSVAPFVLTGYSEGIELYKSWFSAMLEHSGYLTSSNTIFSLFETWTGIQSPNILGYLSFILLSILISVYFHFKSNHSIILTIFTLVALAPSVLVTDTEHFLFSLPLICLLVLTSINEHKKWIWIGLTLTFLLFSLNSTDLWGKELSNKIYNWGCLGIGNLILLGLTFWTQKKTS